jgi:hypothetical protein
VAQVLLLQTTLKNSVVIIIIITMEDIIIKQEKALPLQTLLNNSQVQLLIPGTGRSHSC